MRAFLCPAIMAQAEGAEDTLLADIAATLDGIHAAQDHLVQDTSPEATAIREQISALSSSLQAYNQVLAPQGTHSASTHAPQLALHRSATKG